MKTFFIIFRHYVFLQFGTLDLVPWPSKEKQTKTFAFINQVLLCNPNIRQRKSAFFLPIKQNKKLSQWNQNLLLVCPQTCLLPNTFYNCILQWKFEESNNIMIIFLIWTNGKYLNDFIIKLYSIQFNSNVYYFSYS